MRNLFIGLSTLAILTAFAACSSDTSTENESVVGNTELALSANISGVNYCMLGDIVATGTNPARAAQTITNNLCDNMPFIFSLQPGDYEITMPAPVCTINGAAPGDGYLNCVLDPSPVALTVPLGGTATATMNFRLNYLNREVRINLLGVGAAQLNIGTVTERDYCGPSAANMAVCGTNQVCATLDIDDATYMCYTSCTATDPMVLGTGNCTGTDEMCVPVSGVNGVSIIGAPIPSLNAVPHVCAVPSAPVTGTAGATSTGGATGVGGASSTGGSSAAGGTSAAAGATSVGGTAGAASSGT